MNDEHTASTMIDLTDEAETAVPPFFSAEAEDVERNLLSLRARKYRALASLFRLEIEDYPGAIHALLEPCPGIVDCAVAHGAVNPAGLAALQWATDVNDDSTLRDEHIRLFGGPDRIKQMPVVSPCGAAYMCEDYDGDPEVVSAVYRGVGFEPRCDAGQCPVHISNELDFMAHCLEVGDRNSLTVAHAFVVTHLFSWAVVFAAAVFGRSEHPVTRFGGTMLEHMMFCELEMARGFSGFYAFLEGSVVAS